MSRQGLKVVAMNASIDRIREVIPEIGISLNDYSELVRLAYLGPTESAPWQSFFVEMGRVMAANCISLLLRPPTLERAGMSLVWLRGYPVRVGTMYTQYVYTLDPFIRLPLNRIVSLDEIVEPAELMRSEFYKQFLEPADIGQMLGVDFLSHDNIECHFRICRPMREKLFSTMDRGLLSLLLPHLQLVVHLHSRHDVIETERELYAGAVDRMLVGMVILDETGAIMKSTPVAVEILGESDGISLSRGAVKASIQKEDHKLQQLIRDALSVAKKWKPAVAEAISVTRPSGRAKLGVIVRAIPLNMWSEGRHRPSVAILIRNPEHKSIASRELLKDLFDLTPAEAALTLLLANGLTLEEAAEELDIRKNTARAHLRSIFSKTGVTRQTMLVRLILGSISMG